MSIITNIGDHDNPIPHAPLTPEGKLRLQFQYFARDDSEGDYGSNHAVEPEEFAKIVQRFGLDAAAQILDNLTQISLIGKG